MKRLLLIPLVLFLACEDEEGEIVKGMFNVGPWELILLVLVPTLCVGIWKIFKKWEEKESKTGKGKADFNQRNEKYEQGKEQEQKRKEKERHWEEETYNQTSAESNSKEKEMGKLLGLEGKVTISDIKKAYKNKMKKYHPDKVSSLGKKLQEVAEKETKEINKAYSYLMKKYS